MLKLPKQIFCQHKYTLINQFTVDSEFDIVVASGHRPSTHNSLRRIVVSDYQCEHCDKIKRLKVKTCRL